MLSLAHCRDSRPQFGHSVVPTDAQSGRWAIRTAGLVTFNPLLNIVFNAEIDLLRIIILLIVI